MNTHQPHSDMYKLSTGQNVSLDRHNRMIQRTMRWNKHADTSASKPTQPSVRKQLRVALSTILNIFSQ